MLTKVVGFIASWTTNMATTGNSHYWLADFNNIFSSKTTRLNHTKLDKKHLWNKVQGPLQNYLVSSWLDFNHGHHGKFLFLIGWFEKSETTKQNGTKQEASMEDPVQSFLHLYQTTIMAATSSSCFWFAKKSSPETKRQNQSKLDR